MKQFSGENASSLTMSAPQTKTDTCAYSIDPDETAHTHFAIQFLVLD